MENKLKYFAVIIILLVSLAISFLYQTFGPGITKKQTAWILVHDVDFGERAKEKAIRDGDSILPLIKKESNNFKELNGRNAFWLAEILGAIESEQSRTILKDLYSRTNNIERLTGAVGLAQQGIFPDKINEDSFLVKIVRNDPGQTETELAIIALGRTHDPNALPCLLDLLKKRNIDYWYHALACEAVARIRMPEAIPILRECLKSQDYYALPEAFRALITLGDREAIPLGISRISPELKRLNSGFIVDELQKVTGKSYGYDQTRWIKWWEEARANWRIPDVFTQTWDKQPRMY